MTMYQTCRRKEWRREEDEDSKESINTEFDEWEKGYRHLPAELTATAAIARMDKRFIVVVGMMVKREEELWSVLFVVKTLRRRSKPKKGRTILHNCIPVGT
jgi:hypothetical protein